MIGDENDIVRKPISAMVMAQLNIGTTSHDPRYRSAGHSHRGKADTQRRRHQQWQPRSEPSNQVTKQQVLNPKIVGEPGEHHNKVVLFLVGCS